MFNNFGHVFHVGSVNMQKCEEHFTRFCKRNFIQLFRERLSYKRGEDYATMSKVIMGNRDFKVP